MANESYSINHLVRWFHHLTLINAKNCLQVSGILDSQDGIGDGESLQRGNSVCATGAFQRADITDDDSWWQGQNK